MHCVVTKAQFYSNLKRIKYRFIYTKSALWH